MDDRAKTMARSKMKLLRNIALFTICLLVTDVIVTGYLLPEAIKREFGIARMVRVYSPIYHHGLAPSRAVDHLHWGTAEFSLITNSLGLRDKTRRAVPLASSDYRILFVGDSFTEGIGFDYERAFIGHVTAALGADGIDVLNAGVSSYSPAIYYRRTKHLIEGQGLKVDEVVVLLDISDIDDEYRQYEIDECDRVVKRSSASLSEDTTECSPELGVQIEDFLESHSMIYLFLSEWNRRRRHARIEPDPCHQQLIASAGDTERLNAEVAIRHLDRPRSNWTYNQATLSEWGERGLHIAAANMTRLANFLRSRGIPMALVVYPWPSQIFARDLNSVQVTFWRDWARAHDVRFIDLFPSFISSADGWQVYRAYFLACDDHWNAAGQAYAAQQFLQQFHPAN